jgi:two-component system, OmpR family, phosphate regulon response regulator OmpR
MMPPAPPHTDPAGAPVLLVQHEPAWRTGLQDYLQAQGQRVIAIAPDDDLVAHLLAHLVAWRPALVLLGRGAGVPAALRLCPRLREAGWGVPLIVLADADDELERVLALEVGADDVMAASASPRELLARIRAVLRRSGPPVATTAVQIGPWRFRPGLPQLTGRHGAVTLAGLPCALLTALVTRPHQTVSRHDLIQAVGARPEPPLPRSIDSAVLRLRRLLEPEPARPRYIQTVRRQGYVYVPGAAEPAPRDEAATTRPAPG